METILDLTLEMESLQEQQKQLKEQIEALVKGEDTKFLFDSKKETKFKGAEPGKGDTDDADDDKVDLSKMTYDERAKYFEEHPEAEV